jgi:hypothetical protein
MTLDLKRGYENVLEAMRYTIAGETPALFDTANSATSAELVAYLKSPYVYSGSKTVSITRNKAANPVDVAIGDNTYTAATLAAALNADATFAAVMTADTVMQGNYLRIYDDSRGANGSLRAEDTTGNLVLGWNAGYTKNYAPLRDLAEVEISFETVEPAAYPAVHLRCNDVREDPTAPQIKIYSIEIRIYEATSDPTFGNVLYMQLARYARIIADLLVPGDYSINRNLNNQVNAITLSSYIPATEIETDGRVLFRSHVDFTLDVMVQED